MPIPIDGSDPAPNTPGTSKPLRGPCSALALDVGHRRIGLAGCDPLGLTVTPLPALLRGAFERDLTHLLALIQQRRVQALVLGLPLGADQQPTRQAVHCRRYGHRLGQALVAAGHALPLAWVNEHSSSWAAAERFGLHGDRSGRLDSAAAMVLLEQWLREGPAAEPVVAATIRSGQRPVVAPS
jgi:putative Holliday junction resolvase